MIALRRLLWGVVFPRWAYCTCEPTTLLAASLAISAASTTATLSAQNSAGKAQADYQQKLVQANNATSAEQASQLRIRQAQENEAAARENERARLANQKAKATATVAAGGAGVEGNSVEAMLQEYDVNLGQFRDASERQAQIRKHGTNSETQAVSQGNAYQNLQINAPVSKPNYLAGALNFGSSALGAYARYYKKE